MRRLLLAGFLAVGGVFCVFGAEDAQNEVFSYDFATKPEMNVRKVPGSTPKRTDIIAELALPETKGRSFMLEASLHIQSFQHYGVFSLGLESASGNQKVDFSFTKGDDKIGRCRIFLQAAPGLSSPVKPFEDLKEGIYKVFISYDVSSGSLTLAIKSEKDEELYNSGAIEVRGTMNFSRLLLSVASDGTESSEISYNPVRKALFFRSYVGSEGWYAYTIEGLLYSVAMRIQAN